MRKILLLMFIMPFCAFSQNMETRKIEVTGVANAKLAPNDFLISIAYGETKDFIGKQNIDELEDKILKILKQNGLDIKKDVRISSQNSYSINGKAPLINKQMQFRVQSYEKFAKISSEINFKGINSVRILSAENTLQSKEMATLRSLALENAREAAMEILSKSPDSVGKILSITENRIFNNPTPIMFRSMAVNESSDMLSVENYKDIEISSELRVIFEIIEKK